MKNLSLEENLSESKKNTKRFSMLAAFGLLAIVVLVGVGTVVFSQSSRQKRILTPNPPPAARNDKNYVATKAITVDAQTGKLRKPNSEETKQLVDTLKAMTSHSSEGLSETTLSDGTVQLNIAGRFAPVALGKPNADGTTEVKCVTSFEEGAAFLGLEESGSQNQ